MLSDSEENRRKTNSSSALDLGGTSISFHNAFDIQEDVKRLRPGKWFNDSIIDFRLNCLYYGGTENHYLLNVQSSKTVHAFSTHFYTQVSNDFANGLITIDCR